MNFCGFYARKPRAVRRVMRRGATLSGRKTIEINRGIITFRTRFSGRKSFCLLRLGNNSRAGLFCKFCCRRRTSPIRFSAALRRAAEPSARRFPVSRTGRGSGEPPVCSRVRLANRQPNHSRPAPRRARRFPAAAFLCFPARLCARASVRFYSDSFFFGKMSCRRIFFGASNLNNNSRRARPTGIFYRLRASLERPIRLQTRHRRCAARQNRRRQPKASRRTRMRRRRSSARTPRQTELKLKIRFSSRLFALVTELIEQKRSESVCRLL